MSDTPPVSVIMPVYNGERYLAEAIESVLSQTFSDFELLVLDDGSTDGSAGVARSFFDPRLRLFALPHQGLVATLNCGLQEAHGMYIARMDADDVSHSRRLERQVEYLDSRPDVVMVGSWVRLVDDTGQPMRKCLTVRQGGRRLYTSLCSSNQFVHGAVMMRRAATLAVGCYRGEFLTAEDYDLWLRLGEVGELANVPEVLYSLRMHQDSKTVGEGNRIVKSYSRRAQLGALQRWAGGRDFLGYEPKWTWDSKGVAASQPLVGLFSVALSDWVQIMLWRAEFQQIPNLFRCALISRRRALISWRLILPQNWNTMYYRQVLESLKHGTWTHLLRLKARRMIKHLSGCCNEG